MSSRTILLWMLLTLINFTKLQSQSTGGQELNASQIWEKLEPSFSVPEKYQDKYGSYASPLKFYYGHSGEKSPHGEIDGFLKFNGKMNF